MPPISKLNTEFSLDSRKFNKGIGSARKKLKGFSRSLGSVSTQLAGVFGAAGTGFLVKKVISIMADFESKMSSLKAVTGATSKELDKMGKVARELGSTTSFSAAQVADGMEFLARAGFKTGAIIESIAGVLSLAAAGAIDLGRAADISSNILGAFSLKAKEMTRVVDVMAKTTASANTNIEQLGEAMKLSAPIANAFGVSIEETAAAIGILSNSGLQGTVAGTGLKNVLIQLASPSKELTRLMGGLTLKSDGLVAVLKKIKASGLSAEKGMEIFGKIGGNSFLVLKAGIKELKELDIQLRLAAGTADTMARVKMDNLAGSFKELASATSEAVIAFGKYSGVLKTLTQVTDFFTSSVTDLSKGMENMAKSVRGALFGLFDPTDLGSVEEAIKKETARLEEFRKETQGFSIFFQVNKEGIQKKFELQKKFVESLIKLRDKLKSEQGQAITLDTPKGSEPEKPLTPEGDSGIKTLLETIDLTEELDKKRDAAFEEAFRRAKQQALLEKEITRELKQEARLLKIQAEGNKELFALKEKQFNLEDRLGRKLSENEVLKLQAFITETEQLRKIVEENEKAGQQITEIWEAVGRGTEDAIVDALTGASSAMEGFRNVALAILEDITRQIIRTSLIEPIFGGEGGIVSSIGSFFGEFAHGGGFTVPGSGGTDSSPVSFMATPGERVDIRTPGQVADGQGENITIVQNIQTGVAQTVRAEMLALAPQLIEAARQSVFDTSRRGGRFAGA